MNIVKEIQLDFDFMVQYWDTRMYSMHNHAHIKSAFHAFVQNTLKYNSDEHLLYTAYHIYVVFLSFLLFFYSKLYVVKLFLLLFRS